MNERIYSIAIDGPSGAGKSTLAKAVAAERNILYVDTGAIYRTIGYYVFQKGIDPHDSEQVIAVLPEIHVDMVYSEDGLQHMLLNGEDVTDEIRLPQISLYASAVSAIPEVRGFLLEMQRELARTRSVIMDGRDIGTVVLPDADVKIYLTADVEKRALRRLKELEQRGTPRPYEEVLEEMQARDWADSHREIAPLREAEDAIRVDTSDLNFEESKEALLSVIRGRLGEI
ncbi:MAG: (d)CMP kinase [Oscillospiraceae bacterium]|nr:(d)CMP kinase [Oscillospiraceae bacterium]